MGALRLRTDIIGNSCIHSFVLQLRFLLPQPDVSPNPDAPQNPTPMTLGRTPDPFLVGPGRSHSGGLASCRTVMGGLIVLGSSRGSICADWPHRLPSTGTRPGLPPTSVGSIQVLSSPRRPDLKEIFAKPSEFETRRTRPQPFRPVSSQGHPEGTGGPAPCRVACGRGRIRRS